MEFEFDLTSLLEVHGPFEKVITVPEDVDYIAERAFRDIEEVEKIILQDAVEYIEQYAVTGCPNLKEVSIGKGIKEIDAHAFDKCKNLKMVSIARKKNKVKISPSSFPKGTEILFEGEKVKKPEEKGRYDISMKELRKICTVTSRNTGYSINEFKKDGRISGPMLKNGRYYYEFYPKVTDKRIFIPDTIEGKNVGHVAVKTIPDDAVIVCSAEMFRKLSKVQKASASIAYLRDHSMFYEDETEEIKAFMKKNPESLIPGLQQCTAEQFDEFLSIAAPKASATNELAEALKDNTVLKAKIMDYQKKSGFKKNTLDSLTLDKPKKMTLKEYEKIWNFGKLKGMAGDSYDFNEPLIVLHKYLGDEQHITIPAFIGKTPVRALYKNAIPDFVKSVSFETEDIFIDDSLKNCTDMTDADGFVIVNAGNRKVLTAYVGDRNVEVLTIPEGVTELKKELFCERDTPIPRPVPAYYFKTVILPDSVRKICSFAFLSCFEMETVRLSANLENIYSQALAGCKNLKYVIIPENAKNLDYMGHFKEMDITICGRKGSPAEEYALSHGIPFQEE